MGQKGGTGERAIPTSRALLAIPICQQILARLSCSSGLSGFFGSTHETNQMNTPWLASPARISSLGCLSGLSEGWDRGSAFPLLSPIRRNDVRSLDLAGRAGSFR